MAHHASYDSGIIDRISGEIRIPYVMSLVLSGGMVVQALLGLLFSDLYRDVEWIRFTWFGNDCFTLVVGAPVLVAAVYFCPGFRGHSIYLFWH